MTIQPITPPIAQMSTVRMLMGIGGVMNRFVRTRLVLTNLFSPVSSDASSRRYCYGLVSTIPNFLYDSIDR